MTGAEIEAITEDAPTLGDVRAATEALWRTLRARPAPVAAPAPAAVTPVVVAAGAPAAAPPEQGADP